MVEEDTGVDGAPVETHLEVEMWCCGTSGLSRQSDYLSGFHLLPLFDEVARLVAVAGGEAVGVAYDDVVSVSEVGSRLCYHTVEGRKYLVVGLCLDVDTRMRTLAASSIRTDDMRPCQRV